MLLVNEQELSHGLKRYAPASIEALECRLLWDEDGAPYEVGRREKGGWLSENLADIAPLSAPLRTDLGRQEMPTGSGCLYELEMVPNE